MTRLPCSLLTAALLATVTVSSAHARQIGLETFDDEGFAMSQRLDDGELAGMRGGIRIGDLMFDFVVRTRTIIDGVTRSDVFISSLHARNGVDVETIINAANAHTSNSFNDDINNNDNDTQALQAENDTDTSIPDVLPIVDEALNTAGEEIDAAFESAGVSAPETQAIVEEVLVTDNPLPDTGNLSQNISTVVNTLSTMEDPTNIQQFIQVGGGNQAMLEALANNPALLATFIQNSQDNAFIQQFNELDLQVYNVQAVQNEAINQALNFEITQALH